MPRKQDSEDPFSGMRLSSLTTSRKLDQRLFTPAPASAGQAMAVPAEPASPVRAPDAQPAPGIAETQPANAVSVAATVAPRFSLEDDPRFKASYNYTQEELITLDDLRVELQRQLDKKVTKNDLMRSALHLLLEDHQTNGSKSYATKKIRKRVVR
jgi:hypothetical protein